MLLILIRPVIGCDAAMVIPSPLRWPFSWPPGKPVLHHFLPLFVPERSIGDEWHTFVMGQMLLLTINSVRELKKTRGSDDPDQFPVLFFLYDIYHWTALREEVLLSLHWFCFTFPYPRCYAAELAFALCKLCGRKYFGRAQIRW